MRRLEREIHEPKKDIDILKKSINDYPCAYYFCSHIFYQCYHSHLLHIQVLLQDGQEKQVCLLLMMMKMMYDKIVNLNLFSLVQNNVLFPVLFTSTFHGYLPWS
jgi:hypothetical protein